MKTATTPLSAALIADTQKSNCPKLRLDKRGAIGRKLIDRIGAKCRILLIAWLVALIGVIVFLQSLQGSGPQFLGLTGSLEQTISFQHPVEVTSIWVVEGERVTQHTPLLKAVRYDLESKQSIINENIAEIRARHHESIETTDARLQSLRAESKAKVAEITTQINKLESQHRLNMKILGNLSDADLPEDFYSDNPVLAEIRGLKKTRRHIRETLQAQIQNLEKQLNNTIRPADMQIAELEKRKIEFNRQAGDLKVGAEFSGSVGTIYYKPGEQVPPFKPILTLHAEKPSFIKGYLHEKRSKNIQIGQTVWIQSTTIASHNVTLISGVVEGVGNRIVEFPDRLKRMPLVNAWGRELTIRLADENHLLLDEKVRIFTEKPRSLMVFVDALCEMIMTPFTVKNNATAGTTQFASTFRPIQSRVDGLRTTEIEASGIVWDKRSETYLVVSDESHYAVPSILEMNHQGEVIALLPIKGTNAIDDMESISFDGNDLIVASSLHKNNATAPKSKRSKMIRLRRNKDYLVTIGEIDLYDTLNRIRAGGSADHSTRKFLQHAIENNLMEIEAHAVADGNLLLGFKHPLDRHGKVVIIRIIGVEDLFLKKTPLASEMWLALDLTDPVTGQATALSDMVLVDDQLFLLSVLSSKDRLVSYFWRYQLSPKRLSLLASYPDKRAEGITMINTGRTAMVVFDAGGEAASEFQLTGVKDEIR